MRLSGDWSWRCRCRSPCLDQLPRGLNTQTQRSLMSLQQCTELAGGQRALGQCECYTTAVTQLAHIHSSATPVYCVTVQDAVFLTLSLSLSRLLRGRRRWRSIPSSARPSSGSCWCRRSAASLWPRCTPSAGRGNVGILKSGREASTRCLISDGHTLMSCLHLLQTSLWRWLLHPLPPQNHIVVSVDTVCLAATQLVY